MRIVDEMDNYLGLPLVVAKNKTNVYKYIIDRFNKRIKGWSKRLLSQGERSFKQFSNHYQLIYFMCFLCLGELLMPWSTKFETIGERERTRGVDGQ